MSWRFIDEQGTFTLPDPGRTSYLYFPLVNEAGMMSSITPTLHGDCKTGQNSFLLAPTFVEDLHNSRAARNFWVYLDGVGAWSATGNSARQIAQRYDANAERVTLQAGLLWQTVTRESKALGIRSEITNLVPATQDTVELMCVSLTNIFDHPLRITPTVAIPIYGRSADNLRDHRHVTSLLQRIYTHRHGVLVRPTLAFDERGHRPNTLTYAVLGAEANGEPPQGFFPAIAEFIGEGGGLDWPAAIAANAAVCVPAGESIEGYEAMGALRFEKITLAPGQSASYVLILAVLRDGDDPQRLVDRYATHKQLDDELARNRAYWQSKVEPLAFHTGDAQRDGWLKWVTVQPILRRLFGNSFLPYHDYGRGGRGWRDLWQDCLALLMLEPDRVSDLLFTSFAGVRIDGSNATIIGAAPGEFLADRNNIARLWMDHGAWPWLTTRLYVDQTGDVEFLLREQTFFKDQHAHRVRAIDNAWIVEQGTHLRTSAGEIYRSSILEHLLAQHLTAFFNVGERNNIRLEDADWNDGMDMASQRGESVAFTALYAGNLRDLAGIVLELEKRGTYSVALATELIGLLDTLGEAADYDSADAKQARLQKYLAQGTHTISGEKTRIAIQDLARDLRRKADWMFEHLRTHEWIQNREGYAWFNGYYDDDGNRVEGDHVNGVRMTLTGQVFALMGGIATNEQAREIVRAADHYLYDAGVGGYRLNTNFGATLLNLGRCFGFAFGTKENGAMFSHMAVMYANALYRRGLVCEGYRGLDGIYQHCQNFEISRIYPGIPEYIDAQGRGAYSYLTGSASWLLLTLLTEAYGIKGKLGDWVLEPKLVREQFDANGVTSVETLFAGKRLHVVFHNPARLDFDAYAIRSVRIDDQDIAFGRKDRTVVVSRKTIAALADNSQHRVDVMLG